MSPFIVCYQSGWDTAPSDEFMRRLRSYGDRAQIIQGVWIVKAASTADVMQSEMAPYVHETDTLFVAELDGEAAWKGLAADQQHAVLDLLDDE